MRVFRIIITLFVIVLFIDSDLIAQRNAVIINENQDIIKLFKKNEKIKDTVELNNFFDEIKKTMLSNGFLDFSIDSIKNDTVNYYLYLHEGKQYFLETIKLSGFNDTKIKKHAKAVSALESRVYNYGKIANNFNEILEYYENIGYPFAEIVNDSLQIDSNRISVSYKLNKNDQIFYNNIYIKGDAAISERYLKSYLSIKKNEKYSEAEIKEINHKIEQNQFLQSIKSVELEFYDNYADIYIFLKSKKAGFVTGAVGLLSNDESANKIKLIGSVDLKLKNKLKQGESLIFKWENTAEKSQKIKLLFDFPYILGLPVSLDFEFNMDKKDTSYMSLNLKPRVSYLYSNSEKFYLFYNLQNNRLLTNVDLIGQEFGKSDIHFFGVGFESINLKNYLNPINGRSLKLELSAGKSEDSVKRIFNLVLLDYQFYKKLYKNFIYKFSAKTNVLYSNQSIFKNEYLKFGGNNTLRGFYEDEFLTPSYFILGNELRFLPDINSNIFIFYDVGFCQVSQYEKNMFFLQSVGIGTGLNTKAGFFTISYSIGKYPAQSFLFNNSKIHISYSAIF